MEDLTTPAPEYIDEQDPEVRGPWVPITRNSLDWGLERKGQLEGEAASVHAQFDAWLKRAEKRRDELLERVNRGIHFFDSRVKMGAEQNKEALLRGKTKTVHFLHGSISWRTLGGRLTVSDPKALEEWLATQPVESGFWRMKIEPEMKALQAHCKATGEVPPGTTWGEEYEQITVKAEPPDEALAKGKP